VSIAIAHSMHFRQACGALTFAGGAPADEHGCLCNRRAL
jgi:hypothetical protein